MLGRGVHHAQVRTRGGESIVADLDWSSLRYGRRLDDMSDAEVVVTGDDLSSLAGIDAWQHELVIYRGDGPTPAWAGPLNLPPRLTVESATIRARDGFAWFERRPLLSDLAFYNTDLADIFEAVAEAALVRDPSPGITVAARRTGIVGDRVIVGAQRRRAADELRELADTGVDWTFVGRSMLVGGEEVPTEVAFPLTDADIEDPTIDPAEPATMVSAVGANGGEAGTPLVADAGGVDSARGLVHVVVNAPGIQDMGSLQVHADAQLRILREAQDFFSATLTERAGVAMGDLVPGARVSVAVGQLARELVADLRLTSVTVQAQQTDEGEREQVGVELAPLGRLGAGA